MKPTIKKLQEYVNQIAEGTATYTGLGRKYGITDNGFKKRIVTAGLKTPIKNHRGLYDYECDTCGKSFKGRKCRSKSKSKHGVKFCGKKCKNQRMSKILRKS